MKKEILLNDQGVKMYCIIDENYNVSFEYDKNIEYISNLVKLTDENNLGVKVLYIGKKKILRIFKDQIQQISKISSTELRILRALYYNARHYTTYNGLISHLRDIRIKVENATKSLRAVNHVKWDDKQHLKTELHTHLLNILNAQEFVDFVSGFNIKFPLDENGNFDIKNGTDYKYSELIKNDLLDKIYSNLSLDISKETDFDKLEEIISIRSELIKRCAYSYYDELTLRPGWLEKEAEVQKEIDLIKEELKQEKSKPKKERDNDKIRKLGNLISEKSNLFGNLALAETYNLLLERSLKKFKDENIEYSEISFSSPNTLRAISKKHEGEDNFKLLMSIHREDSPDHYKKASKNLEDLLYEGTVIGLDIMGYERPINDEEYDKFIERYEWVLPVLHMYPNSVLRIHAGEFVDATENVYKTLKAIKETSERINACCEEFGESWGLVPPPRIRIGHGINIEKKPELVELMKELDVVVEFNISSNYSLGNVDNLEDLPIKYYDENGIKYVIATDGGGMYSTSILQEENLAKNLSLNYVGGGKKPVKTADIVKNASITEEEIIKHDKPNKPSIKDREIYEKYRMKLESKGQEKKVYSSYIEALEAENKVFDYLGDRLLEIDKIQAELRRLERYMYERDISLDDDYINERIAQIRTLLSNSQKTDEAKIYLFLLEKEKFPELDTSFVTLDYVYDPLTYSNERIVGVLRSLIGMVEYIYYNEENENSYRKL